MVYKKDYGETMSDEGKLAFDLRLTNNRIVSKHWFEVTDNRNNYPRWFHALRCFYTVLHHDVVSSRVKQYETDFLALQRKFLELINKYPNVYSGRQPDSDVEWKMQEILFELERRLTSEVKESRMQGDYLDDDGL